MRLFYQSFGVSRGSRDGAYGQVLKRIVDSAAAPGTEISVNGLSPHRAIAEQYRYLEFLEPPKSDQRGEAGAVGVRNVRLTRRILTVSATCGISETKIVDQQIRYSLRSPKRRSLILDTNRGLPGISSPPNYYTECGVQKWKIKDRNSLKLMHSSRTLYPVLMLRGVKIVANSTLMVL